jgi:hypothetical protein
MKQCIALAGLACLLASGCAQTGLNRGAQAGHVAASQRAPRPTILRDFRKPGKEPLVNLASYDAAGACTDACCGVEEGGCGCAVDGCCQDGSGGPCQRLINGIAGGGCGPGCGLCPNGQTYPEYPTFNQGPPVGQTAYPYYTVHGPRDFLAARPPTIGPY